MDARSRFSLGASASLFPDITPAPAHTLICELCGQAHRAVWLAPRERAVCIRCGRTLLRGSRLGGNASAAFALTGLLFAIPALSLPLVTVGKLGNELTGSLFTSVAALWDSHFRVLALWVLVCGILAPLALLATCGASLQPRLFPPRLLHRVASHLQTWAMPEVQILAILVAFTKLGSLVNVIVGPGLWCYAAMTIAMLLAWRTYDPAAPSAR